MWGDGSPKREFLHVDDLAEALYTCMENYDSEEIINIGTGEDVTIKELAETIVKVTGYQNYFNGMYQNQMVLHVKFLMLIRLNH